jgi:hypothetical protein
MDDGTEFEVRQMRFRSLRVALSIICAVACVLLLGLWVRSYWVLDRWESTAKATPAQPARFFFVSSYCGRIRYFVTPGFMHSLWSTNVQHFSGSTRRYVDSEPNAHSILGYNFRRGYPPMNFNIPYSIPAIIFAAAPAALWIRWSMRFSLRTLLIATTLIAAVLGLIVWLTG